MRFIAGLQLNKSLQSRPKVGTRELYHVAPISPAPLPLTETEK